MSYVLDHHNAACDPFGTGLSNDAQMALGSWLTRGMRFALPLGAIILFRRRLYPDVGAWRVCGIARPDATTVTSWPGFAHEASMGFQYATARALGNGFISKLNEPVRVEFDKTADLVVPPLPLFPLHVVATPIADGHFEITWTYSAFGQGAPPASFRVFRGTTLVNVNYSVYLADYLTGSTVVPYLGEGQQHLFTTAAYADGSDNVFAVRSYNGVVEQNVYTTPIVKARAGAPEDAAAVSMRMRRS